MAEGCGGKGLPVVLGSVGMFRVLQVSSRMRPLFVPARAVKRCGWEQGGGGICFPRLPAIRNYWAAMKWEEIFHYRHMRFNFTWWKLQDQLSALPPLFSSHCLCLRPCCCGWCWASHSSLQGGEPHLHHEYVSKAQPQPLKQRKYEHNNKIKAMGRRWRAKVITFPAPSPLTWGLQWWNPFSLCKEVAETSGRYGISLLVISL